MLNLDELQKEAEKWRNDDKEHSCATCEHCKGSYQEGFHCKDLAVFIADNFQPAGIGKVMLADNDGICGLYVLDKEMFIKVVGRAPYDADNPAPTMDEWNGLITGVDNPCSLQRRA